MPWQASVNHNQGCVINHYHQHADPHTEVPHPETTYPAAAEPQVQPDGSRPAARQPLNLSNSNVQPTTWDEMRRRQSSTGFLLYPVG